MNKKNLLLIVLVIMFSVCCAYSKNDTWERIAPNNYVDMDAVVGLENIYGYSFLLKSYNKGQYEPVNGRQIHYTLSQNEIDCAKRKYKIGIIDSYDENDNFINGDYNKYAEFQPIVSGTAMYEIAKSLCRL